MNSDSVLLRVRNLVKYFAVESGVIFSRNLGCVKAVDDVSFSIQKGQTLGLVGESGCGKTTTGRLILRLLDVTSGGIEFDGVDITHASRPHMRKLRRDMQIIFQDPYSSLNSRMAVGSIVGEPLLLHGIGSRREREQRIRDLLDVVGLSAYYAKKYPHEFSGGQRQRIGIARALALNPKLIICDEPVSALDVSIQAQILNLLKNLQKEFGLTYLFIAHDLSVVKHISNRVAVMYLGKIVELADKSALYGSPNHPYTKALLSSIPVPKPFSKRKRLILTGDIPSPIDPPAGCRFHTRCIESIPICSEQEPKMREIEPFHFSACWLNETA